MNELRRTPWQVWIVFAIMMMIHALTLMYIEEPLLHFAGRLATAALFVALSWRDWKIHRFHAVLYLFIAGVFIVLALVEFAKIFV